MQKYLVATPFASCGVALHRHAPGRVIADKEVAPGWDSIAQDLPGIDNKLQCAG